MSAIGAKETPLPILFLAIGQTLSDCFQSPAIELGATCGPSFHRANRFGAAPRRR